MYVQDIVAFFRSAFHFSPRYKALVRKFFPYYIALRKNRFIVVCHSMLKFIKEYKELFTSSTDAQALDAWKQEAEREEKQAERERAEKQAEREEKQAERERADRAASQVNSGVLLLILKL